MEEAAIGIEEVVAVGYGTMKKRDIVGSVATIKSEEISKLPVTNVAEALQGMSSGMMVSNRSGHPGSAPSIRVRGLNSINLSSDPLCRITSYNVCYTKLLRCCQRPASGHCRWPCCCRLKR